MTSASRDDDASRSLGMCSAAWVSSQDTKSCQLSPVGLSCEHLQDPLGIDVLQPRLSWKLVATKEGLHDLSQSAYRILVASKPELLKEQRGDCGTRAK